MRKTIRIVRTAYVILTGLLLLGGVAAAQDAKSQAIVIGTASPGGVYLTYGQTLAGILARELKREVTPQPTQGPAQNIVLLEKREVMLAFTTMGVGLHAWNGTDWAKGTKYRAMRLIFPMYDTPFQFVAAKRLQINWLDDLAGLRIGAGPRAGTGGTYVPSMFKALDIKASVRFGAMASMASQLQTGDLDGVAFVAGVPTPALAKLSAEVPVDFIRPTAAQVESIRKALPEMSPSKIPGGTYASLDRDYETIGLYNFAVAHNELPDDLVYRIVKAVFANHGELVKAQASAKETVAANIGRNTILPLHPGALRYYRENKIPVPAEATN